MGWNPDLCWQKDSRISAWKHQSIFQVYVIIKCTNLMILQEAFFYLHATLAGNLQ